MPKTKPRKLTLKERQVICGCTFCCDEQNYGYCQYTDECLTERNKLKIKQAKANAKD